jgi:hypothetical protein
MDCYTGMLHRGTDHRVMDRLSPLLDEGDVKLHPLIRLIGNRADLLLLIRGQRIPGALRLPGVTQKKKRSRTHQCDAERFS